jgi:hypothetical protein
MKGYNSNLLWQASTVYYVRVAAQKHKIYPIACFAVKPILTHIWSFLSDQSTSPIFLDILSVITNFFTSDFLVSVLKSP